MRHAQARPPEPGHPGGTRYHAERFDHG